jgi:hypothetical protein
MQRKLWLVVAFTHWGTRNEIGYRKNCTLPKSVGLARTFRSGINFKAETLMRITNEFTCSASFCAVMCNDLLYTSTTHSFLPISLPLTLSYSTRVSYELVSTGNSKGMLMRDLLYRTGGAVIAWTRCSSSPPHRYGIKESVSRQSLLLIFTACFSIVEILVVNTVFIRYALRP